MDQHSEVHSDSGRKHKKKKKLKRESEIKPDEIVDSHRKHKKRKKGKQKEERGDNHALREDRGDNHVLREERGDNHVLGDEGEMLQMSMKGEEVDTLVENHPTIDGTSSNATEEIPNIIGKSNLFLPEHLETVVHPNNVIDTKGSSEKKFKASLKEKGIIVTSGRWTKKEDDLLAENWNNIFQENPHPDPYSVLCQLPDLPISERRQIKEFIKSTSLYISLARGLNRTTVSCYYRARSVFHPGTTGSYTDTDVEEVMKLRQIYGNSWSKIGRNIGRAGQSVYGMHRWRELKKKSGVWSSEEEEKLLTVIREIMGVTDLTNMYYQLPWQQIAEKFQMRSARQCRSHWIKKLCWTVNHEEERTKWSPEDSIKLLQLVYNLPVSEEREIEWDELLDKFTNAVSPQYLQKRWYTLASSVPSFQRLTFEEICDALYEKYFTKTEENIDC